MHVLGCFGDGKLNTLPVCWYLIQLPPDADPLLLQGSETNAPPCMDKVSSWSMGWQQAQFMMLPASLVSMCALHASWIGCWSCPLHQQSG